jgi:branched-chain amino acid transport system ATP-binding protein
VTLSPLLRVANLSKHFDGVQAVDDLSLDIFENEITGLIGPNGAGKTTLFQMISGFEKADQGTIFLKDQPIHHLTAHQIAKKGIARTFQTAKPFANLTVLENVMIGYLAQRNSQLKATKLALETLEYLELGSRTKNLADHLSLPEKKRLEIARALSITPKLLLLDEVMAGLRPVEIDKLVLILQDLKQRLNLTFIMIEHNMRAVMACCQRVIVLAEGKKIAEDTPFNIQQHPEVIKTYLGAGIC